MANSLVEIWKVPSWKLRFVDDMGKSENDGVETPNLAT